MREVSASSWFYYKKLNILCGQKVELLNVKRGGAYSYHLHFKAEVHGMYCTKTHAAKP